MLADHHRRHWRARGFTEDLVDQFHSDGLIRSLTEEEIQREWLRKFPKMSGVMGGALLLTFNRSTQSLKPDSPEAEKYLYALSDDGAEKGKNTQPFCPDGTPACATEGLADALVATHLLKTPCCGVTAPSHLGHSILPDSVKVYVNDADVPFHYSKGFLPMVIAACRSKKLRIAHVPRDPAGDYRYTSKRFDTQIKWGIEEAVKHWKDAAKDPCAEFKSLIDNAMEPIDYVRAVILEYGECGIKWPVNDSQICNVAKAIAAATSSSTQREPLKKTLSITTGASVRWIEDVIKDWDANHSSKAITPSTSGQIEIPEALLVRPRKADLQRFIQNNHQVRLNEVTGLVEVDGHVFTDIELADQWLAHVYGIEVEKTTAVGVFNYVAASSPYNPIAEYIDSLRRLQGLRLVDMRDIARAFGIESGDHASQELLARHLVGHIERGLAPGTSRAKHDQILVLIGVQGTRKSSSIRALAPQGLYDSATAVRNLEDWNFLPKLNAAWIFEFDECELMLRMRSAPEFKGFITRISDRFTPKYKQQSRDYPRRAVLWGTTNNTEVLNDHTGNRRVWIIPTGSRNCDPDWIAINRDSIWATVMTWRDWGLANYLSDESNTAIVAAERAQQASLSDPWERDIQAALESEPAYVQQGVAQDLLMRRHLGVELGGGQDRKAQMRVTKVITSSGFTTHDGKYRWENAKRRFPDLHPLEGWSLTGQRPRSGYIAVLCSDPDPTSTEKVGSGLMPWQNSDLSELFQPFNHLTE
jgi:predicted P-loop ATPase